jgi:hypothetical protein
MGKGVIVENLEDGLYSINYQFDTSLAEKKIAAIDKLLATLDERKDELDIELADAQVALLSSQDALNTEINNLDDGEITAAAIRALTPFQTDVIKKGREVSRLLIEISINESDQEELNAQKRLLNNLEEERFINEIWCADLTDTMEKDEEVGVIEVPGGNSKNFLNIRPGKGQTPTHTPSDGVMTHAIVSEPEAVFYNSAMKPGWLKFNPRFRYGKITQLTGDKANVELEEPTASDKIVSEQGYNLGPELVIPPTFPTTDKEVSLLNIAIDYLTCNGAAFTEGDVVLIDFRDPDRPEVIGFKDNPKPCDFVRIMSDVGSFRLQTVGTWAFEPNEELLYGTTNWVDRVHRIALSWVGPRGRYANSYLSAFQDHIPTPAIWSNGELLATAPGNVIGACVTFQGTQRKNILAVTTDQVYQSEQTIITEQLWTRPFLGTDDDWQLVTSHDWTNDIFIEASEQVPNTFDNFIGHYFFNESGTQAVCVKHITWRNPADPTGSSTFPWSRSVTLDVTLDEFADPLSGTFTFEDTVDGEVIRGDNWNTSVVVARDFQGDVEVTASVHTTQTRSGSFTTLTRTLTTSEGHDFGELSYGEQGASADENRGKTIQYLDLRSSPAPVVIYRNMTDFLGPPMFWSLRAGGFIPDQEISGGIAIGSGTGSIVFSSPFSGIPGTLNHSFTERVYLFNSGTTGLSDNNGVILADTEYGVNFMYPVENINAVAGLSGVFTPIGVG